MIISSSQVALGYAQSDSAKLTQSTQTTLTRTALPSMNGSWAMEVDAETSYEYSQYSRTLLNAQSKVRQGEQSQQHTLNSVTENLAKVSLGASDAQIAIQKAFPSGPATDMVLSGEVAFNFSHQIHYQQNSSSLMSAQGSVTLADGRSVDFNLLLSQQQATQVSAKTQIEFGLAKFHDPLVINFGTDTVQLQDTTFEFDMQANGDKQTYASLGKGSGYLTFDVNGDGQVNDGSELFGTQTGDAYAELAKYDDDHNGWIDENDAIFQRLKIWQDQSDTTATLTLTEAGVGAIYLGNVDYDQELRGAQGEMLGKTKQAGVVLMENGEVKTSQAIDLAKIPQEVAADKIENSRAFKNLQAIADAFNQTKRVTQSLQGSFQVSDAFNSRFGWSISKREDEKEAPKSLFQQLQEYIEQQLKERKKMLEDLEDRYNLKKHRHHS
ncbi:hypothetical protein [Hydrogenovibrio sp. JE_KL2]|uniref:hypothetical protein n=1 Tax=Hydrogenovibrio sp. JE_KL2 TaxID=2651188 RepID=UPI00128C4980|nr:hypothetical protein [Hydrogenovibrio sp. JE_KL2]MPQ75496.1 hypothetical protein [Hydrogenovibrio sp. JE_KL2]